MLQKSLFLGSVLTSAFILQACTHAEKSSVVANQAIIEPEIIERNIASSENQDVNWNEFGGDSGLSAEQFAHLDADYGQFIEGSNPEAVVRQFVDRKVALYFRAEKEIDLFDKKVAALAKKMDQAKTDQEKDLIRAEYELHLNSENYRNLIAVRSIAHEYTEKISFFYLRLMQDANQSSITQLKTKAQKVLNAINAKIKNHSNQITQLGLQEALENTKQLVNQYRQHLEKTQQSKDQFNTDFLLKMILEQKNYIDKKKSFKSLTSQQFSGPVIDASLEIEIQKLSSEIKVDSTSRVPQQVIKIMPSVDKNGNITGREFPANTWAMTYDDGPASIKTLEILELLKRKNAKATFFALAKNVKSMQPVVQKLLDAGMPVVSHSYSHENTPKLSKEQQIYQITQSVRDIEAITKQPIAFFRLPYGAGTRDPQIRQIMKDTKVVHVFWNVDSLDWQDKNPASIVKRCKDQMKVAGRGIVLMHDIHSQTVTSTAELLDFMVASKHRFVTIPEIVDELNGVKK